MPKAHDDSTLGGVRWEKIKTNHPERVVVSLDATPVK
jgi:hypothetical protein